jgi:hypothetical protein
MCSGAIRKHPATLKVDRKLVERTVSKWLTGARDRDGKRDKRRQAAATSDSTVTLHTPPLHSPADDEADSEQTVDDLSAFDSDRIV